MMPAKVVIFGGSGFVGSCLAGRLAALGVQVTVPTRRPERRKSLTLLPKLRLLAADIHDPLTLGDLIGDADAVINLVGILHDRDGTGPYGKRFAAAHVELPRRIVAAMKTAGVRRLLHMSALRASLEAPSAYLRSKAAGEGVVLDPANELDVTVFRPSVIFGPNDAFLNLFAGLLAAFPLLPLAGANTRFQPVYVGDVADAFCAALSNTETIGKIYELGGPTSYRLRDLVAYVGQLTGHARPIYALPYFLARLQAGILGALPKPPMSPDNLRSLQVDSITDGLHDFPGWQPQSLEAVAPTYLKPFSARSRQDELRRHSGR